MQSAEIDGRDDEAAWRRMVRVVLTAVVIGSMAVTFSLSFAAIVYSGPIAGFLSQGIALTLVGAAIMGIVGPLTLSYRGTLVQPQDVTAILLALSAASIVARPGVSAESAFVTVVALIALSSVVTGIAAWAMGALKLGYLVRFVPFPVVSGFLAASGALLIRGALDMVSPVGPSGDRLALLLEKWPFWLPWLALAIGIAAAARKTSNGFIIPAALLLGLAAFYASAGLLGVDLETMRDHGLLLGPFQGASFASGFGTAFNGRVDWSALVAQLPIVLTIVGISLLGTLLNASALELAIDREIDFERDLKGVGISNVAAGLAGGMVGYHTLGESFLARRFGVVGIAAGAGVAAASVAALFLGAELLSYLPIGLFAAVIWYLGIDLMLTAIWDQGRRLPPVDLMIVLVTPMIALVFGFMPAVGFGVAVAAVLFVVAYSQVDATRLSTTGASFHARVERSPKDQSRLAELGAVVQIHKLEGFLFFGSASTLVERLQRRLDENPQSRFAIIDLKKVVGMDMSAWAAFERLARGCRERGIEMIITGLSAELSARFRLAGKEDGPHFRLTGDLDDALMDVEETLLAEGRMEAASSIAEQPFELDLRLADLLRRYGYWMDLAPGDVLLAQGARSDHLIFLLKGRLRASVTDRGGKSRIVTRFLPGAIVGEIAYYADVPRTATVTVETPAAVVRIDAEALKRMEHDDAAAAASFHRMIAVILARRLMMTTRLLNDAEL